MRVSLLGGDILTDKCDVLLLTAASKDGAAVFSPSLRAIDRKIGGLLTAAAAHGFCAAAGDTVILHTPKLACQRIVLVGCGDGSAAECASAVGDAVAGLGKVKSLTVCGDDHPAAVVAAAAAGAYRYCFGAASAPVPMLKHLRFYASSRKWTKEVVARGAAIGEGIRLTRHLAEQPGNVCTPSFLAAEARRLGREFAAVQTRVLDEKQLRTLKAGALLAVSQGSREPPKMIVMQYRGGEGAPIALIGKGVTFDSGGISLKPGAAMDEMKFDMGGAAAVFGAVLACARMQLPLNIVAIMPSCENMPDGAALKPGDVVRAMNGKTIEVLNTDAEGRLILADALTYCGRYKPAAVVDVATLTGACVIALGRHFSGMTSRCDKLAGELTAAGEISGDGCWRLPLGGKYSRQLKTDYADLANIGGREAGATTAACFLSNFVDCEAWAHLDIAGSAWTAKKRATGRPVSLLMNFLMRRAGW